MTSQIAQDAERRAREIFDSIQAKATEPTAGETKTPESVPTVVEPAPTVLVGENDPAMLKAGVEEWKHRFEVMQGKYNAEVPRLHEEVRALKAQLVTAVQQAAQPAKATVADAMTTLREELGDSAVEALRQLMAQQTTGTQPIPSSEPTLPAQDPSAQQAAEAEAQQAFDQVGRMVDGALRAGAFQQINHDPAFQQYLTQTVHPQTGTSLHVYMTQQFGTGNLSEVARVFLSYARLRAEQAATQTNQARDKIAAPDASGLAGGGQADGQRTYSRAEYEATMKALLHDPKYKTAEGLAVANRLRMELLEALRDGRVV